MKMKVWEKKKKKMKVWDFLWVLVIHIQSVLTRNHTALYFGEVDRDGVCCLENPDFLPDGLFISRTLGRLSSKVIRVRTLGLSR